MEQNFLGKIKSGDILVRSVMGGGFTSYSLIKIEHVDNTGIFIEGADGDYETDSVYRFSKVNGKSINNYVPGFSSQLIRFATDEDKSKEENGENIER